MYESKPIHQNLFSKNFALGFYHYSGRLLSDVYIPESLAISNLFRQNQYPITRFVLYGTPIAADESRAFLYY